MRKLPLVVSLFFIAASSAIASDWTRIALDDKTAIFMDFASIAKVGKNTKAWVKINYMKNIPVSALPQRFYRSSATLFYFDCHARTFEGTQQTLYSDLNLSGETVHSVSSSFRPALMQEVIPDTNGERMLSVACSDTTTKLRIKRENQQVDTETWGTPENK